MAEYVYNQVQNIAAGQAAIFNDSIPCPNGNVCHRNESGNFILRGNTCNSFARYQVTFNGNIAVPTDGTAGTISIGVTLAGEVLPTSLATVTPTTTGAYFNVTSTAIITVPRGSWFPVSVDNASDQAIELMNANFVITRVA